jgi:23S rRNA (guanine745-N1)-methyltransferase
MSNFICPVCGKELIKNNKSLTCKNNHNFDIAKSGYANLLLSQQIKAKHHGDDKVMVRSRRDFLNKGYFNLLLESVSETVKKYAKN